jgi:hypothetical protein
LGRRLAQEATYFDAPPPSVEIIDLSGPPGPGPRRTAEEAELAELQATADKWLEPLDQQRLEMLKPYEELARRLTQKSDE